MVVVLASLACGLVFGVGLAVSGMMNPEKVLGFLDVAGSWDPTLAFVMAGALAVTVPGFALLRIRESPMLATMFQFPQRRDIDRNLLTGAGLFGLGWGLVGFCPGPAFAALGSGLTEVLIFVAAMIAGMFLYRFTLGRAT